MLQLLAALFPIDGKLIWTRRIAAITAIVAQVGFLYAALGYLEVEKMRLAINGSIDLIGIVFAIFVSGKAVHAGLAWRRGGPLPEEPPK